MSVPTHTSTTGTHEQCMLAVCHIGCNAIHGVEKKAEARAATARPGTTGTLCPPRASYSHIGMTGSDPCMHMDNEGVNTKSSRRIKSRTSLQMGSRCNSVPQIRLNAADACSYLHGIGV
jgi:hypothetical protein